MSALLGNKSKHTPVLVNEFINAVSPVKGTWVDCTFGAGGYSTALLEAGAEKVIGIDKDPNISNPATIYGVAAFGRRALWDLYFTQKILQKYSWEYF